MLRPVTVKTVINVALHGGTEQSKATLFMEVMAYSAMGKDGKLLYRKY